MSAANVAVDGSKAVFDKIEQPGAVKEDHQRVDHDHEFGRADGL